MAPTKTTAKSTAATAIKPQTIGYMRLRDGLPARKKKEYRDALTKAGALKVVDEKVGEFGVRPKFDRLLKSLTPSGKLVVIRETHISDNEIIAKGLMGRIAQARVELIVLHSVIDEDGHFQGCHDSIRDGGDGGGNGGGGGGGGGDGGGGGGG